MDEDFDALTLNSPSEGTASRVDMNVASGSPITYTLNATGLGWISATGWTKLGIRFSGDIDNATPPNDERRYVQVYAKDGAGSTQDPKLIVEHTTPSAPVLGYGARKSATQTLSTDATVGDDSELLFDLTAGKEYHVHGTIFASSTSKVPDIKIAFSVPSGAEMDLSVLP